MATASAGQPTAEALPGFNTLGGVQARERVAFLAELMLQMLGAAGNRLSLSVVLATIGAQLGLSEQEVGYGVIYGEAAGLLVRSEDCTELVALTAGA